MLNVSYNLASPPHTRLNKNSFNAEESANVDTRVFGLHHKILVLHDFHKFVELGSVMYDLRSPTADCVLTKLVVNDVKRMSNATSKIAFAILWSETLSMEYTTSRRATLRAKSSVTPKMDFFCLP